LKLYQESLEAKHKEESQKPSPETLTSEKEVNAVKPLQTQRTPVVTLRTLETLTS